MPGFWQDLRYALRHLLKTPTVTVVAVLSLALGIGANTAIFGVINALMLRSLPVQDPQQLVSIGALDPGHPDEGVTVSLAMFNEIREHANVFSNVFLWSGGGMSNFEANGVRYAGSLGEVSGDYFAALGVAPILGRFLTHDDAPLDGRPSAQIAVIAYGCWKYCFGGDQNVIGKAIRVDGIPLTIVGVSPANFKGLQIDSGPEATANLLLARAAARQREFGVRVALGAGRWPLIRMILIEALLLSCTGAVLGLLMAPWTARYLLASFWTGYGPAPAFSIRWECTCLPAVNSTGMTTSTPPASRLLAKASRGRSFQTRTRSGISSMWVLNRSIKS